jgi:tetratricopeptide (TPR) repeat protein
LVSQSSSVDEHSVGERHIASVTDVQDYKVGDRWAIIVGISRYEHERLNLKYADRDAEELYKLLMTPSGGGFEEDHIKKLINEEATTSEITKALRSFLKKPAKEDIVLLYFACHGAPDPARPNTVYLLPHDTDPEDISGTALPMREIDQSLRENLYAERIVIIADTCHSAAIGGRIIRGAGNDAQVINAYLQQVSKAKGGVALLTSAEASESAQEDEQWGGGHGVFTHFILQGIRGDADGYGQQAKDGKVTVGELFEYVRENVKRTTNHQQHPVIGTNPFDRNLPMAITGGINAQEIYQLGCHLYNLGFLLNDIKRFQAAAEQFKEATILAKTAKIPFPEAELGLGQALLAFGDREQAISVISRLIEHDKMKALTEALFYLGIAHVKQHDYMSAITAFEKFLLQCPEDKNADWVREYVRWLKDNIGGRKYALLIGINQYQFNEFNLFKGCVNDVMLMKDVLTKQYRFEESNVLCLTDRAATRQSILKALGELCQKTSIADTVIVHYSGHSMPESKRDAIDLKADDELYLIVHDTTVKSGYLTNGISPVQLHQLMNAIPATSKTLILDTYPNDQLKELIEKDGNYTLLLASDSATERPPVELDLEINDHQFVKAGLFTGVLSQKLRESKPDTLTCGELLRVVIAEISKQGNRHEIKQDLLQTPVLIGDRNQLVFAQDLYLSLFEFAQRRNYSAFTLESLVKQYSHLRKHIPVQFAEAHYSFGLALFEKGDHEGALEAFETAVLQHGDAYNEALLALGIAQFSARHYAQALKTFEQCQAASKDKIVSELIEKSQRLLLCRKHALLVGINKYINKDLMSVQGAVNDVLAFKEALITKLGFKVENITVLVDYDATRSAILDAFKKLIELARDEPALFFFAGNGSHEGYLQKEIPIPQRVIVSADGRLEQVYDIPLQELAELAKGKALNLVTILDAGCADYSKYDVNGIRSIPSDAREKRPASRDITVLTEEDRRRNDALYYSRVKIGHLSIYNETVMRKTYYVAFGNVYTSEAVLQSPLPTANLKGYYGIMTHALISGLVGTDNSNLTYAKWFARASRQMSSTTQFLVLGDHDGEQWSNFGTQTLGEHLDEPVFESRTLRGDVLAIATSLKQQPILETIGLLRRMIEQREKQNDPYPEGRLNLGIAYFAMGEYDKCIDNLEHAIALYSDPMIMSREKNKDPNAEDHYHEAHYQLGRVLFDSKRDFARAVSELKEATRLAPENAHAYYYLGKAIMEVIKQETLIEAKRALTTYLVKGAPLGHEDEVRKDLGSRIEDVSEGNEASGMIEKSGTAVETLR